MAFLYCISGSYNWPLQVQIIETTLSSSINRSKYLILGEGIDYTIRGINKRIADVWLLVNELTLDLCESISSLVSLRFGVSIAMNLSSIYLLKELIHVCRLACSCDIVAICANSHRATIDFTMSHTHGQIFSYKVATSNSTFSNHLVVALSLSTMIYNNAWETNTIPNVAAEVDERVGPEDTLIGSEVESKANVDVAGVPSPYVLTSGTSIFSPIIKFIPTPAFSPYILLGSIGTYGPFRLGKRSFNRPIRSLWNSWVCRILHHISLCSSCHLYSLINSWYR